uniref:Uncharacterized protein n=1 Tax=Cajanus cajan TaxID=3821 RepID=A0A151TAM8_CAJCA|nr:hypothetical protein KK1_018701 [Cajanus cajan]
MIFYRYLAVRPWTSNFASSMLEIKSTLVWIRFPSLKMEYYNKNVLLALALVVGRPIEINLNQLVVGCFWFHDHWFNVEHECMHLICKCCDSLGIYCQNL